MTIDSGIKAKNNYFFLLVEESRKRKNLGPILINELGGFNLKNHMMNGCMYYFVNAVSSMIEYTANVPKDGIIFIIE